MGNVNTANITLYQASPQVNVPNYKLQGGRTYVIVDTVETNTVMSVNDTVTLCRLPVDAILTSFKLATDDTGSTGDIEIGFYRTIDDGAAALDADALVNLLDVNAAATVMTEYRFDTLDINTAQQPVWDIATVSARPSYEFIDIKANFSEITTAAATFSIQVMFTT